MAARRWRDSLTHLTLHCCEGATPSSLECLKAAAGAALQSVELRCCCLATGELAAGAWGPRGRERPAPAARALIADWWSDD